MRLAGVVRAAIGSTALLVGQAALAQNAPAGPEARVHFARATEMLRESRWLEAIPELEAARRLAVTPAVLFNLGLAQRAVGRSSAALATFRTFQETMGEFVDHARRDEVADYVRELAGRVGRVSLRGVPEGATVDVDGAVHPATGVLELDPGRHVLVVRAEGYLPASGVVDLGVGEQREVELHLAPRPVSTRIVVDANVPSARITVDDVASGHGTLHAEVVPGLHRVVVTAPGYETVARDLRVARGGVGTLLVQLPPRRAARPLWNAWWLWGACGLAAGAAIGAGAAAAASSSGGPAVRPAWGVFVAEDP